MIMLRKRCAHIVEDYLEYKSHVCRQVYCSDSNVLEKELDKHETAWPDYKETSFLMKPPSYLQTSSMRAVDWNSADNLADRIAEGKRWLDAFFTCRCRTVATDEATPCTHFKRRNKYT